MGVFTLKHGDTRPVLEVALQNPDGSPHDLTGATVYHLLIRLPDATVLTRDLVPQDPVTAGVLRYTWVAADWTVPGNLPAVSPLQAIDCPMEYEVVNGLAKLTFPNGGHDTLHLVGDLA